MGIINRTMDGSEQKEMIECALDNPVNAQDNIVGIVSRSLTITDAKVSLLGISGAPNVWLKALRFIAGTGGSSFAIGSTFVVSAFGTSGYQSYSLPAAGSTLLNLQKGDMLVAVTGGGAGAACTSMMIELVVQNIADIKTWY